MESKPRRKPLPPIPDRKPKQASQPASNSKPKPSNSSSKSQRPKKEPKRNDLLEMAKVLAKVLKKEEKELDQAPPEERKEAQGWLDWGLNLLKEWGPKVLEAAPELLALL